MSAYLLVPALGASREMLCLPCWYRHLKYALLHPIWISSMVLGQGRKPHGVSATNPTWHFLLFVRALATKFRFSKTRNSICEGIFTCFFPLATSTSTGIIRSLNSFRSPTNPKWLTGSDPTTNDCFISKFTTHRCFLPLLEHASWYRYHHALFPPTSFLLLFQQATRPPSSRDLPKCNNAKRPIMPYSYRLLFLMPRD